ncbi:DNA topoisomerase III [Enterobacter cancerogenus]|uniref:DNA topoisomerase III n=1 Tax=Enterobacter cancerogenus TaxID=69218 RepID=A0AB38NZM4_9ENTR|nr:DNA topoisomerase III [Enterobacter cancerogenus]TKK13634.1 DNA topoisomerase III [Enterobacter cancerogenus]
MQYALFDVGNRKILLDATEFGLLKDWKKSPVKELSDFDESNHSCHLCYGGYLLNPDIPDFDIRERLKKMEGFWLAAIDDTALNCHQIAFYSIYTLPVISIGYQKIVPFAVLIKSDDCIIHKIATKSDFAVSAFLRVQEWDIATNILNREGIFAFNGVEMKFKEPVNEDNWKRLISEERAIRCANKLIRCKG